VTLIQEHQILSNIVIVNYNLFDILNLSNEYLRMLIFHHIQCNFLKEKGVPFVRFSNDKTRTNKYGNKFIELYKRCSLHIANGRLDKDRFARMQVLLIIEFLSPNVFDAW